MTERPRPTPGPVTSAMRLRPGASPEVARERSIASFDAIEAQLAELVQTIERLHAPTETTTPTYCRECLMPHPCRTVLAVRGEGPTPAPPEEGSQ